MLRALRFRKRLRVLPTARIDLPRSGPSAGMSPRGGANEGIAASAISHRAGAGKTSSFVIGAAALAAGLGFAAYRNVDRIGALFAPTPATQQASQTQPAKAVTSPEGGQRMRATAEPKPTGIRAQAQKLLVPGGTVYVRRQGSVLRATEKVSGATLKKLDKGAPVTVVAVDGDWTQVRDTGVTGWMRTSVLGPKP